MWQAPVFDRTASDVAEARRIKNLILSTGWDNISSVDKSAWSAGLKGVWKPADYNRAKENIEYLVSTLSTYSYSITLQAMPTITDADVGKQSYIELLTTNMQTIIDAFAALETTPSVPAAANPWNWAKVNDLEKILYDTKTLIDNMTAAFVYSGEFYAGE